MKAGTELRRRAVRVESLEHRRLMSGWSTVDAVPGYMVMDMAADGGGNVYAVGQGLVRQASDGGATWATVLQSSSLAFNSVVADGTGDVYVAGTNRTNGHWIILERPVGQGTFSVVDDVASGHSVGLAADAAGDVFAIGKLVLPTSKNGTPYWAVRERRAGQSAFGSVDLVPVSSSSGVLPRDVAVIESGPSAGIYVVGGGTLGAGGSRWVVRKSADGGSTWSQVDNFRYDATGNALSDAWGVAGDAAGNVYVVGIGQSATLSGYTKNKTPVYKYTDHWVVRKSGDGGTGWTVDDDFAISPSKNAEAYAVGTDLAGNVYVIGDAADGALTHGIVRTNADGGWATVDDYLGEDGQLGALDGGFACDSRGNLYAGGWDFNNWIIRSAVAPMPMAAGAAGVASSTAFLSPSSILGPTADLQGTRLADFGSDGDDKHQLLA